MDHFDVTIVGAGVIGLAVARALSASRFMGNHQPSIVLLEEAERFGQHISSRNSEVIHAGIYYPSGSLKADLCVRGKQLMYEHCKHYQVPFLQLGKFIVAQENELPLLEDLRNRAYCNGVEDLQWTTKKQLQAIDPNLKAFIALYSPSTGIIDSHAYMSSLLQLAEVNGVLYSPRSRVLEIGRSGDRFQVSCQLECRPNSEAGELYQFTTTGVVNCAGLNAQQVATKIEGVASTTIPALHLCKGDYFTYTGKIPFNHLIYPVPETNNTGLGIHATVDLGGQVKFGPDTQYIEGLEFAIDPSKATDFAAAIASYFPAIKASELRPHYAGIRPKLSGPGEGAADFIIQNADDHQVPGLVQLYGIESPGLTASLAIAERVVAELQNYGL